MRSNVAARNAGSGAGSKAMTTSSREVVVSALWASCTASMPSLRSPNALIFATHHALLEAGLLPAGPNINQPREDGERGHLFTLIRGELTVSIRSLQRQCLLNFKLRSRHPDELAAVHQVIHAITKFLKAGRPPVVSMHTGAEQPPVRTPLPARTESAVLGAARL